MENPIKEGGMLHHLTKKIEDFSSDLYECLEKKEGENFVCTTLSCNFVLAMAAAGAKTGTAKEMHDALHLNKSSNFLQGYKDLSAYFNNSGCCFFVNKIYVDERIIVERPFKEAVTKNFNSEIQNVDFINKQEAVKNINDWCKEKTCGKIEEIITADDMDNTTKMVLLNVIYFKNFWSKQFKLYHTKLEPFFTSNWQSDEVPTMKLFDHLPYMELKDIDADCLALPYKNRDFALIIIMQHEVQGLDKLEEKLKTIDINYQEEFGDDSKNIHLIELEIPKFKIESSVELKEPLQKLGMKKMFIPYEANFKGISKKPVLDPPLYADKILQKVVIDVNEKGTEAVGVTYMQMCGGGGPSAGPYKWLKIKVDRPFLFRLVNLKTNLTLFSGRVVKPVYPK